MTHSEMSLAYTLFCIKYDGWNVRDIPNIKHASPIEKIEFEKMYIQNDIFGFKLPKIKFEYNNTMFFSSAYELKLNRQGRENFANPNLNSYSSLESFLKDFEISFVDII